MKIAWFTPLRRRGSGIAVFSAATCAALSETHEVVVFASDVGHPCDPADLCLVDLPIFPLVGADARTVTRDLAGFSLVVYNMGDHVGYHKVIHEYSLWHPGVVVLHDLVMRDFFAGYYLADGPARLQEFLGLMEACHGPDGAAWMADVVAGRVGDVWSDPGVLEYHMARAAVAHAHGVVTHSGFALGRVADFAGGPVVHIPFPAPPLAAVARAWDPPVSEPGRPVRLLTVGHVNRNKQVDLVIETIASNRWLRKSVVYDVIGPLSDTPYHDQLVRLIDKHRLGQVVRLLGDQPDEVLHEAIRRSDVMVVLRKPHMGESSWSLLEALFAARPTIVWDHGFYAEIPDAVTRKVTSSDALRESLEELCRDPALRNRMGREARRYASETFDARAYGRNLVAFAESVRRDRVALAMADRLARRSGDLPWFPETQLERVAGEISRLADDRETAPDPYGRRARAKLAAGRAG
jgi:glycosyltransferase involved in cell wall biosynthesis